MEKIDDRQTKQGVPGTGAFVERPRRANGAKEFAGEIARARTNKRRIQIVQTQRRRSVWAKEAAPPATKFRILTRYKTKKLYCFFL